MDEEKEELPLICDVCGKTPDVEVRKYEHGCPTASYCTESHSFPVAKEVPTTRCVQAKRFGFSPRAV